MATNNTNKYLPWLIGFGAIGLIGFIFKDDLKKLFKPKKEEEDLPPADLPPITTPTTEQMLIPAPAAPAAPIIIQQPAQTFNITPGLSTIGTPKNRLNMGQVLKYGDKGQEIVKLQQLLNRISDITKKPYVTEDGVWGPGTEARLNQMFGNTDNLNLYKIYAALYAINQANDKKELKNWFTVYQGNLNNQLFFGISKKLYLQNNKDI